MDAIKFAGLISYITHLVERNDHYLGEDEIDRIASMVKTCAPAPITVEKPVGSKESDIEYLLAMMQERRKIEAVKAFRDVTGAGLRGAMNAVERCWPQIPAKL
jgi:ribosomal protein L7/L12